MANKIKITVDSTCDMTPELCRQYDVTKIPLSILLGAQAHDDGIDITPDDIYAYYERTGTTAKTAAVPPSAYLSLFEKYTKEGYEVVHLGFTAKLSSSFQNAVLAAGELEGVSLWIPKAFALVWRCSSSKPAKCGMPGSRPKRLPNRLPCCVKRCIPPLSSTHSII